MPSNQNFTYREWQYPRISSFLPLLLLMPSVWIVAAPFNTNIGLLIGAIIAVIGAFMKLSTSKHIEISGGNINLGSASIPLTVIGDVSKIPKENHFAARGSELDSRAFVFLKYGLPEIVKIEIRDPKDPTPYLLVSTRNADRLIAAIKA